MPPLTLEQLDAYFLSKTGAEASYPLSLIHI